MTTEQHQPLTAPFPYWGGKRAAAPEVWRRFGPVHSLIEPFSGTGAITLACPYGPRHREIWNDLDGLVCNFYRALRDDPETVAFYADWPTSHLDLIARKGYCLERLPELQRLLMSNPLAYDPIIAGYWVWCVSNDIGLFGERSINCGDNSMPKCNPGAVGKGVSAQRSNGRPLVFHQVNGQVGVQGVRHSRPAISPRPGSVGVTAQREQLKGGMCRVWSDSGGQGVQAQRSTIGRRPQVNHTDYRHQLQELDGGQQAMPCCGDRLMPTFTALAQRLFKTYILCKDWKTLCSPSVMGITPSDLKGGKTPYCGIFLDPPYATEGRGGDLYRVDSLTIAHDVQEWAIRMGQNPLLRIAVCGYKDDYKDWPEGWTCYEWRNSQIRMGGPEQAYDRTECIWFSPHCLAPDAAAARQQPSLFDLVG